LVVGAMPKKIHDIGDNDSVDALTDGLIVL
jgi:hypothetical protein